MASRLITVIICQELAKSVTAKARHKKVLSSTKGHYGQSRLYKTAKQSNIKSLQYAFRDRKQKKIFSRFGFAVNAGCRELRSIVN